MKCILSNKKLKKNLEGGINDNSDAAEVPPVENEDLGDNVSISNNSERHVYTVRYFRIWWFQLGSNSNV